jgi:hypothetical protein
MEMIEDIVVEVGACRRCPRLVAWREAAPVAPPGSLSRAGLLGTGDPRIRRSAGPFDGDRAGSGSERARADGPAALQGHRCPRGLRLGRHSPGTAPPWAPDPYAEAGLRTRSAGNPRSIRFDRLLPCEPVQHRGRSADRIGAGCCFHYSPRAQVEVTGGRDVLAPVWRDGGGALGLRAWALRRRGVTVGILVGIRR